MIPNTVLSQLFSISEILIWNISLFLQKMVKLTTMFSLKGSFFPVHIAVVKLSAMDIE